MSKLQKKKLLLVNKFLSSGLKVLLNLNKCIIRGPDGEVTTMKPCEGNLYKMYFIKVHRANTTNWIQSTK